MDEKEDNEENSGSEETDFPTLWIVLYILCPTLGAMLNGLGERLNYHMAAQLRAALCALVFQKTMKLNIAAQAELQPGQIIALVSADAFRVFHHLPEAITIVPLPLKFLFPFILLLVKLGWYTWLLIAVLVVLLPIMFILLRISLKQAASALRPDDSEQDESDDSDDDSDDDDDDSDDDDDDSSSSDSSSNSSDHGEEVSIDFDDDDDE